MFKFKITLHRHNAGLKLRFDIPNFWLPSTFHDFDVAIVRGGQKAKQVLQYLGLKRLNFQGLPLPMTLEMDLPHKIIMSFAIQTTGTI